MELQQAQEKTGQSFSEHKIVEARDKSFLAMERMASQIKPGMLEEEAHVLAKAVLSEMGAEKHWHRPTVRFGRNTLKAFSEPSQPGIRLGESDIFFLDLGPVFGGHEGDVGATYVVGGDPEMARCAQDARRLFEIVRDEWKQSGRTGAELYRFAETEAERLGWKLHPGVKGHRVSEFPHALHFKGKMADAVYKPSPRIWILEIQIRHPTREFGAFYEDLLD